MKDSWFGAVRPIISSTIA